MSLHFITIGSGPTLSRHAPPPEAEIPQEAVPSSTVALLVEGFKEEALDGWYRRRDKCIVTGSPAFFHGSSGAPKLFMYKQASGRWVISPVRGGSGGEADLLRAARLGQDRGVACQKAAKGSFSSWREFYQGRWVETKLHVEMFNFEDYERYKRRHGDVDRQAPIAALPAAPKEFNRRQVEPRAEPLPPKSVPPARTTPVTEKEVEKMLLAAQAETKRGERLVQQRDQQLIMEEEKNKAKAKGSSTLLAVAAKLHSPPEAKLGPMMRQGGGPVGGPVVDPEMQDVQPAPEVSMAAQTAKASPVQVAIAASTPKAPSLMRQSLMEQLNDQGGPLSQARHLAIDPVATKPPPPPLPPPPEPLATPSTGSVPHPQ
eukprot:symbB.v1.2.011580.t1/scaffold782.1/size163076/4